MKKMGVTTSVFANTDRARALVIHVVHYQAPLEDTTSGASRNNEETSERGGLIVSNDWVLNVRLCLSMDPSTSSLVQYSDKAVMSWCLPSVEPNTGTQLATAAAFCFYFSVRFERTPLRGERNIQRHPLRSCASVARCWDCTCVCRSALTCMYYMGVL